MQHDVGNYRQHNDGEQSRDSDPSPNSTSAPLLSAIVHTILLSPVSDFYANISDAQNWQKRHHMRLRF
jgi:hypothetical protein